MAHDMGLDPVTGKPVPVNIVHASYAHLILFLVLNMWPALLGLPILVAIIVFSRGVRRHPTFLNLCIAFIVTGIVSSMLVYPNKITGPEPDPVLCLLQASTIYGVPPLLASAAFMLVLQMFFKIRAAHYGVPYEDDEHKLRLWLMIIIPYIGYFIVVLATAVIGANDPTRVSRNRRVFYCSVENLPLTNSITIASGIILFGTIIMEAWKLILLVQHRKVAKQHGSSLRRTVDLPFILRVLTFCLYIIAAMCLSLLSVTSPSSPVPDLVIAFAPTAVIIIFGTQMDIIHAMCFWRRSPPPVEVEPDSKRVDLKYAFDADSIDRPAWPQKF